MKGEKLQNEERTFFFFFFFFAFAFQFSKLVKFVLEFSTRKKHFTLGKNQEKWLCPSERYSSYAPDWSHCLLEGKWTRVLHGLKVWRFEHVLGHFDASLTLGMQNRCKREAVRVIHTFIHSAYTTRMLQPIWIQDSQNMRK